MPVKRTKKPPPPAKDKTAAVMLRVPVDLLRQIEHAASKKGLKRAAYFIMAAAERSNRDLEVSA